MTFKDIQNMFIKGLVGGLGFAIAIFSIIFVYEALKPNAFEMAILDQEQLSKIVVKVNDTRIKEGKVLITGDVKNKTTDVLLDVYITVKILENGKQLEVCGGGVYKELSPETSRDFFIKCGERWTTLDINNITLDIAVTSARIDQTTL